MHNIRNNTGDMWWDQEGQVQGTTIYEEEEVRASQILGPNGKPFEIRKPKIRIGFDLSPRK